jgi:hypothetical protein
MSKMGKKWFLAVLLAVLVFSAFLQVSPVNAADDTNNDCVDPASVTYVRYDLFENPTIPLDAWVEFVGICNSNDLAIKYEKMLGSGTVTHYYVLPEWVRVYFEEYTRSGIDSGTSDREPIAGDRGIISHYADMENGVGDSFEADGVIDYISVTQVREWSDKEARLVELGHLFYLDLKVKSLIFIQEGGQDCYPTGYRMNGIPLSLGPWGNTYVVPKDGGNLQRFYQKGNCGFKEDTIVTDFYVKPGDMANIFGVENVEYPDPWGFCYRVGYMSPRWQVDGDVYDVENACSAIQSRYDTDLQPTLNRLGFHEAFAENVPEGYVPYVFLGKGRVDDWEYKIPSHHWVNASGQTMVLGNGESYTVTVDSNRMFGKHDSFPRFELQLKNQETKYWTVWGDLPDVEWVTPIVFVPDNATTWERTEIFRVWRSGLNTVQIQTIVWDK